MAKDIVNLDDYRDAAKDTKAAYEAEDEDDLVELVDEDGNTVLFEHIMTLEHEGADYVLLAPAYDEEDEDGGVGDEEQEGLVVLRIIPSADGNDDEDTYEGVTDEKLLAVIYQKYIEAAESEGFDE